MGRQQQYLFISVISITLVYGPILALDYFEDVGNISVKSPFFTPSYYTSDFDSQIMLIDGVFCGPNDCYHSILAILDHRNPQCHYCSCRADCFLYHNCCPYVSLDANIPYGKRELKCQQPGSKPSKNGLRWSLKSTCPAGQPPDLVYKCEKSTELDINIQMPVLTLDPDGGSSEYKNKYCAECNGQIDMYHFSTKIKCINSTHVFTEPTSNLEKITAALIADDCTLDYFMLESRECEITDEDGFELIDSCNVTGQWEEYDELVVKGCLLKSYKIPVFQKYYNVFCYVCNNNYTWGEIKLDVRFRPNEEEEKEYRLQGIIPDGFETANKTANKTKSCFEVDDTGLCRDVLCPYQHEYLELYSTCQEEEVLTNAFGYEVCFVTESLEVNPSQAALELNNIVQNMKRLIKDVDIVMKSSEEFDLEMWNCEGKVTFRVQTRLELASIDFIPKIYLALEIDMFAKDTLVKPPEKCGQITKYSSEEERCKVTTIVNTGTRHIMSSNDPMFVLAKSVHYLPLSKLSHCCQMALDKSEYTIDNFSILTISSSQKAVNDGDYLLNGDETVRVCADDIVQPPYQSPCSPPILVHDVDGTDYTTSSYGYLYDVTLPPEAIGDYYMDDNGGYISKNEETNNTPIPSTTISDLTDRNTSNLLVAQLSILLVNICFFLTYAIIY